MNVLHLLVVVLLAWLPVPAAAQSRGDELPSRTGAPSAPHGRLDAARERWERLSPAEQARVRERFERLRAMPEDDRDALAERARLLADAMRRVEEKLGDEARERVARLDPERRRELLRDLALAEGGERIARWSGAGPADWRAKLESLPAAERERVLGEMRRRGRDPSREHSRERLTEMLAKKHGLATPEIERILALPEPERWDAIRKLHGASEGRRPRNDDPQSQARRKLFEAARPRSSDHLRYAELAPSERRELVARISRGRVVTVLREAGLAAEDEIARLDVLTHDEFRRALQERFSPPHGRGGGRHGGPPDDRRGPPRER